MPEMMQTIELPTNAADHFWSEMRSGLTLAEAVAAAQHTRPVRRIFTFLPKVRPQADLTDFTSGGMVNPGLALGEERNSAEGALIDLMTRLLDTGRTLAWVLEDKVSRPEDAHLADAVELLINGDEIYHVVRSGSSRAECESSLSLARDASGVMGFLTDVADLPLTKRTLLQSREPLNLLASDVRYAFVSVYDGESYMVVELA